MERTFTVQLVFSLLFFLMASAVPSSELLSEEGRAKVKGGVSFWKFRPRFHFLAPSAWINDPCGPYFDPKKREYHLFFQYNPKDSVWGDIVWGHAVSPDSIFWTDKDIPLSLGDQYDKLALFSGSVVERGYRGLPTLYYTGANSFPIHWTKPYIQGSEQQAMAISEDGGETWQKFEGNPLIPLSPVGERTTGFRDPYVFRSKEFDRLLDSGKQGTKERVYMVVNGGEKDGKGGYLGGRLFLYISEDFAEFEYAGALFSQPARAKMDAVSGDFGFNFELSTVFPLEDSTGKTWHAIVLGTEGGRDGKHGDPWSMWALCTAEKKGDGKKERVELELFRHGAGDWGTWYAANTFEDPVTGKRIAHGWVNEDDTLETSRAQGWAGVLGIPREIFLHEATGVMNWSRFGKMASFWPQRERGGDGVTATVRTLGVRPLSALKNARQNGVPPKVLPSGPLEKVHFEGVEGKSFELQASLRVGPGVRAGFTVRGDSERREETVVFYDSDKESIIIDRSRSSTDPEGIYNLDLEEGFLPLYEVGVGGEKETLDLHILVDNSIVEVFANERFALSSRVYPMGEGAVKTGGFFEGGGEGSKRVAEMVSGVVWTEFEFVFPDRPEGPETEMRLGGEGMEDREDNVRKSAGQKNGFLEEEAQLLA